MVANKIGLIPKSLYTAFVAVLVPFYLMTYGPTNFLFFCDISLLLGLFALWLESPMLASMPAVGIIVPQAIWCVDFVSTLFGHNLVGMTSYMFDPQLSLFARGLSLFHGWLPFVLLAMVYRIGYDRRAVLAWSILSTIDLPICYFLMPGPPAPLSDPNLPVNINLVYGFSSAAPQTLMPALTWFILLVVAMPLQAWLIGWLLGKFMPNAPGK